MKLMRWILAALMIMMMSMCAMAQDDPFVLIKSYDFQNRQPAYDINKMIHDNLGDKAKLAGIEKKLVAILADPQPDFCVIAQGANPKLQMWGFSPKLQSMPEKQGHFWKPQVF